MSFLALRGVNHSADVKMLLWSLHAVE